MREGIYEVVPGKVYQRKNFLTWPIARKQKFLSDNGITLVVNLWGKIDSDLEEIRYIVWPVRSDGDTKEVEALLDLLYAEVSSGGKVLIHCEAGMNRSTWLCGKLLARCQQVTAEECLKLLEERVPRSRLNSRLQQDLTQTCNQLNSNDKPKKTSKGNKIKLKKIKRVKKGKRNP